MSHESDNATDRLARFRSNFVAAQTEMGKIIAGQEQTVQMLLVALLAGGHVMLTGLPGLGRTLIAKTLARVLGLTYNRIQFTPDLLPSDIIGTEVLERGSGGGRHFKFFKGPIFSNLLLADEINRSPARTQAALLEAMHEGQITIGGQTHFLPKPFIVVATRNSQETEGVWRMPEAQIDRFLASIELLYPNEEQEIELLERTTGAEQDEAKTVLNPQDILEMQEIAKAVPITPAIKRFALEIVRASRPAFAEKDSEPGGETQAAALGGLLDVIRPAARGPQSPSDAVRLGASPRAAQAILRGAKVLAIVRGRCYVASEDVITMAYPVLEHRLVLDMRASSRGVKVTEVIKDLIDHARKARSGEQRHGAMASILRK